MSASRAGVGGGHEGAALLTAAAVVSLALVAAYVAAGGSSYAPTPSADPCLAREWRDPEGIEESTQQFALSALDGAACELGVSRERLAVALASEEGRAELAAEIGIGDHELEAAVRAGLQRAIDDAEAAGAIGPLVAGPLRELAARVPVDEAIALIAGGAELFTDAGALLDRVGSGLDGLLP